MMCSNGMSYLGKPTILLCLLCIGCDRPTATHEECTSYLCGTWTQAGSCPFYSDTETLVFSCDSAYIAYSGCSGTLCDSTDDSIAACVHIDAFPYSFAGTWHVRGDTINMEMRMSESDSSHSWCYTFMISKGGDSLYLTDSTGITDKYVWQSRATDNPVDLIIQN